MSTGYTRKIISAYERAASSDINTVQEYVVKDRADFIARSNSFRSPNRRPMDHPGLDSAGASSVSGETIGLGTTHDCFSGLLLNLEHSTSEIWVNSGSVGMGVDFATFGTEYLVVNFDSLPVVVSQGLLFESNGGGTGARIDVIECRPIIVETNATRDIFDPTTQQFGSQSVVKESSVTLEFRIRKGDPDAGFPGTANGWMPIAVSVMQISATSFAQVDFYDVRPLVHERSSRHATLKGNAGQDSQFTNSEIDDRSIQSQTNECIGWVKGEFNGYLVGGTLRTNTPWAATTSISHDGGFLCNGAENQLIGGLAPSAVDGALNAICLIFPMNLGRWVRYSRASVSAEPYDGEISYSNRIPQGTNGILVIGRPTELSPRGEVRIQTMPTLFGVGATSAGFFGLVVGWAIGNGGGYRVMQSTRKSHFLFKADADAAQEFVWDIAGAGTSDVTLTKSLTKVGSVAGLNLKVTPTNLPLSARSVFLKNKLSATLGAADADNFMTIEGPFRVESGVHTHTPKGSFYAGIYAPLVSMVDQKMLSEVLLKSSSSPNSTISVDTDLKCSLVSFVTSILSLPSNSCEIYGWEDY